MGKILVAIYSLSLLFFGLWVAWYAIKKEYEKDELSNRKK